VWALLSAALPECCFCDPCEKTVPIHRNKHLATTPALAHPLAFHPHVLEHELVSHWELEGLLPSPFSSSHMTLFCFRSFPAWTFIEFQMREILPASLSKDRIVAPHLPADSLACSLRPKTQNPCVIRMSP